MSIMPTFPKSEEEGADKARQYGWTELTREIPRVTWLPTASLKVDHDYQRQHVSAPSVLAIAAAFDWSRFGALSVARRGDEHFVTDGQHRLQAALKRGIKRVPCTVTESSGVADEARAFLGINSIRRPVTAFQKYRAMLRAGDELHVRCEAMLQEMGLAVSNEAGRSHMTFPALLLKTFSIKPDVCEVCLVCQREAIGPDETLHNYVHKGLFYIATHQTRGDVLAYGEKMRRAGGLTALVCAIKAAGIADSRAGISDKIAALGILQIVNQDLKKNRIIL